MPRIRSLKASLATGVLTLRARGKIGMPAVDVLRLRPNAEGLIDEIGSRGWTWSISRTAGQFAMQLAVTDAPFVVGLLDPPSSAAPAEYTTVLDIGGEEPKLKDVETVDAFRVSVATPLCWRAVTLDHFSKEILEVRSILWDPTELDLSDARKEEASEAHGPLEWALKRGYRLGKDLSKEQLEAARSKVRELGPSK